MHTSTALLLCIVACFAASCLCTLPADEPTFAMIKGQGAAGQWALSIFVRSPDWQQVKCTGPQMGACFNSDKPAPFDRPLLALSDDRIKVDYNWTGSSVLKLFNRTNMDPQNMVFKLCYSNTAFVDRPWRKKNKPYPAWTQNCPFTMDTIPFPKIQDSTGLSADELTAMSGSIDFSMKKNTELTSATLFVMMWVTCSDGKTCAFASTESPTSPSGAYLTPYNGTYVQVQSYNPITTGIIVAASILSAFGPLFFIVYYIADVKYYNRTGKTLTW